MAEDKGIILNDRFSIKTKRKNKNILTFSLPRQKVRAKEQEINNFEYAEYYLRLYFQMLQA